MPNHRLELDNQIVLNAWNSGKTLNGLSRMFDCSISAIVRRLSEEGVTDFHSRSGGASRHYVEQANELWSDIRTDADAGMTLMELRKKYHMSRDRLESLFIRHDYDYEAVVENREKALLQGYLDAGLTVAEIGAKLGKSERTAARYLKRYNLTKSTCRLDITNEMVLQAWNEGLSVGDIARKFGCAHDTITKRLDKECILYDRVSGIQRHFINEHESLWQDIKKGLDCGYSVDFLSGKYHIRVSSVKRLMELHEYKSVKDCTAFELYAQLEQQTKPSIVTDSMFYNYQQAILSYYDMQKQAPTVLQLAEAMGVQVFTVRKNLVACGLCGYVRFVAASDCLAKLLTDLDELDMEYELNNRRILKQDDSAGKELDVYIPEFHLGIEVNPTYTHSVDTLLGISDRNYHQEKSLLAEHCGVGLLHMYEDDFFDEEKYQKILLQLRLRKNGQQRIGARLCEIQSVNTQDRNEFLNQYHFQGGVFAKCQAYGLYYQDELVSLFVVGSSRYTKDAYEILRYCVHPGYAISGGFVRLFSYFLHSLTSSCDIISYLDLNKRLSCQNIYEKSGFVLESLTSPDYAWYHVSKPEVLSRYQTTKTKLIAQGYDGTKTEVEIMRERGYCRVFRAGAKRYVYHHIV